MLQNYKKPTAQTEKRTERINNNIKRRIQWKSIIFRFDWNHYFSFSWKVNAREKIKGKMVSLLIVGFT